ncbi:McrB family protein [Aliivibrio kagoshimensis]|uniref:McrB family protein n=1 Tax=Aliivibrio kagoshimensis TaxID=2910230 RepID=UPI003D11D9BD
MSVYLLTWNPKHFSTGGEGSESGVLNYAIGEQVRWSCHSQQPKMGDTVYLIRVGVEPRGIVAKGTVTKESYLAEHWSDESKQKRYIDFKLEALRSNCAQGLLPMMLLHGAMPEQKWSTQTSGIEIKPEYQQVLSQLWSDGSTKHSVAQFLSWYLANEFDPQDWYKGYIETCALAKQIQDGKEITEQDVKKLWHKPSNGIADVGQGFMYQRELDSNPEFLLGLTREILANPTEETYKKVVNDWKLVGNFERVLWGVIHRVFAAAAPKQYTSIIAESYLNDVFKCLKKQYQLETKRSGSWLSDNTSLLELTKPFIQADIDDQTRNILLWSLYEWKVTSKNPGDVEGGQVKENEADYEANQSMNSDIATPVNQILYGPPGTGKTYLLQKLQHNYTSIEEVQSREQWLAEKLDALNWMQVIALCLLDINGEAKVVQIVEHDFFQAKARLNNRNQKTLRATAWSYLQKFTVTGSKTVNYKDRSEPAIFDKSPSSYWYIVDENRELIDDLIELHTEIVKGPKSAHSVKRYSMTTFHQSYGYEEFIEGLRAKSDEQGNLSYPIEPGSFLKLCQRAKNDPSHQYAMFIDEINRGNISKIFGELISLIEVDKRSGCEHAMSIKLAYSGEEFSVPSNVDIIGTMNTADRSLAMMDTALRRRFDFVEMMPKTELLRGCVVNGVDLEQLLSTLNQRIEILYDREHTLGHAFFMSVKALVDGDDHEGAFTALVSVFQNKIIPLLEEYFFEDWDKIRLVLADNQKDNELQFVTEKSLDQTKLNALFGQNHGLNQYGETQKRYILKDKTDDVWQSNLAYQGIYSSSDDQGE